MSRPALIGVLAWSCCHPLVSAAEPGSRSVEAILAEVESLGQVDFEVRRKSESGYLEEYRRRQHALYQKKAELLLEACRLSPADPRVEEWMPKRWHLLGWNQEPAAVADEVLVDIDQHLPQFNQPAIAKEAAFYRALYRVHKAKPDGDAMYKDVAEFIKQYPDDPRGAGLLSNVADAAPDHHPILRVVYGRLAAEYPSSHFGKFAAGKLRRLDAAGQPFELAFNDAVTGKPVSIADFRGKVVMVEFWTTKCLPCLEELPKLKALHAKLRDRGVEFIGVSLDEPESEGGLKNLRELVALKGVPWPQYYQGNGNNSEFSKSWGVGSTPTKFLIDAKGNFLGTVITDDLERRINELLGR